MANCPCGSTKTYTKCCGPYLSGKSKPATAEALMRSRYSAFVKKKYEYLTETLHPGSRTDHDLEQTKEWAETSDWLDFEVLETEAGGKEDDKGEVEFLARYRIDGKVVEHHEKASFERVEDVGWVFTDGKLVSQRPVRRDAPKVGRNDPCPCGSGKKYKKCCAA